MNSLNILYVDNDEEQVGELSLVFNDIFANVDVCSNGQEGLIKYTTNLYDIVLSEIEMPIMDGLSMSQEIRQINPNQHIIILSNTQDSTYLKKCLNLGISDFISRPCSLDNIVSKIEKKVQEIKDYKRLLESEKKLNTLLKNDKTLDESYKDRCLSNIPLFKEHLKDSKETVLIMLDIDNFTNINDSYGFDFGDKVLLEAFRLLKMFNFNGVELFKLEADKFALLNNDLDINNSIEIAKFIISFFNEYEIEFDDDCGVNISFSIGISSGRGIRLLSAAKIAIDELRVHARGTYQVYDMKSKYVSNIQQNIYWVNVIQNSVASGNIVAFFQPIVNNKTKKIEKYECLARILDDDEYVSPFLFMDAAKSTHLITKITKSMIKQSCKKFSGTDYEFSINITNDDLQTGYLEEYLLRNIKLYDINPNRIVLEILEDISTLDHGDTIEQLESLQSKGFKLAIDDFGSESSNFSRLLEFDPEYLKIDGSFIKNILDDEKSRIITEAIVFISHKRGIKVIAEFIHSKEVQDKIDELGIEYSQGYYHGAPSRDLAPQIN